MIPLFFCNNGFSIFAKCGKGEKTHGKNNQQEDDSVIDTQNLMETCR